MQSFMQSMRPVVTVSISYDAGVARHRQDGSILGNGTLYQMACNDELKMLGADRLEKFSMY
jgi:hypothetical protein